MEKIKISNKKFFEQLTFEIELEELRFDKITGIELYTKKFIKQLLDFGYIQSEIINSIKIAQEAGYCFSTLDSKYLPINKNTNLK